MNWNPRRGAWLSGLLLIGLMVAGCKTGASGGDQAATALPVVDQPTAGSRHFLGPAYWGNRLQDGRFEDGRFVCVTPQGWLGMRTLHDLTRQVTDFSTYTK